MKFLNFPPEEATMCRQEGTINQRVLIFETVSMGRFLKNILYTPGDRACFVRCLYNMYKHCKCLPQTSNCKDKDHKDKDHDSEKEMDYGSFDH